MKAAILRLAELFVQYGLWPSVAVYAMYEFRTELGQSLGRINKLGPVGLDTLQPQSKEPLESERARHAAEEAMKGISDNPVLIEIEDHIRKDLEQRELAGRVEAIPALVKSLAAAILSSEFEAIYSTIFGSQLAILTHLNGCIPKGESVEIIKQFYTKAAVAYPAVYTGKPFEEYIAFLTSRLLVREEGGRYHLTNKGKEFIVQTVKIGYTLNKLL